MSLKLPPEEIADEEELGRAVTSERDARRARDQGRMFPLFVLESDEEKKKRKKSVDRLSLAPTEIAVANGERIAAKRQEGIFRVTGKRSQRIRFCGWAVVVAGDVRNAGCEAVASPVRGNPDEENLFHADVRFPVLINDEEGERLAYAQAVARRAQWRDRPMASFP